MKLSNGGEPFEVDVKRFYFPTTLEAKCPTCGTEVKREFSDDYLSYPTANKPFDLNVYCAGPEGKDDHNFTVKVMLRVALEAVAV